MLDLLARFWWVLVLRGVAALAFGIAAVVWPGLALLTLIYLFGAYALVDGVFALGMGLTRLMDHRSHAWTLALEGLVGILIGLIAFATPGITALALLFLIAAWALITGIAEVALAILLRERIQGEWALILTGAISILFALALIAFPRTGALAVVWTIGLFAVQLAAVFASAAWATRMVLWQ